PRYCTTRLRGRGPLNSCSAPGRTCPARRAGRFGWGLSGRKKGTPVMAFEAAVHVQAIELDKISLERTAAAGAGRPSTAMSLGHIVTVLMFHTMRWSPDYPAYPTSDRLVLSEGHAVPIVYAAACKLGVVVGKDPEKRRKLTMADTRKLREADSELDGHPNPMEGFPFFDAATGSLGQGLSVAAG